MAAKPPPEICPRCNGSTSDPQHYCDHPFHEAPRNTTPCPNWCTDNHWYHDDHRTDLATCKQKYGPDHRVVLSEWTHTHPEPYVTLKVGLHGGYEAVWLEPRQADELAKVLTSTAGAKWMINGLRAARELAERIQKESGL